MIVVWMLIWGLLFKDVITLKFFPQILIILLLICRFWLKKERVSNLPCFLFIKTPGQKFSRNV